MVEAEPSIEEEESRVYFEIAWRRRNLSLKDADNDDSSSR